LKQSKKLFQHEQILPLGRENMERLKVGFLSFQDYLDRNAWSGTLYYMQKSLKERNIEVIYLGERKKPSIWQKILNRLQKNKTSPKLGSSSYIAEWKKFASRVQDKLSKTPCDVIFAPVASAELTFLETSIPIVYLSDATFKLYQEYYQLNLDQQEADWASKQEFTAVSKASKLVYSSEWAANSAICDYQAEYDKVEVISFGANLEEPPAKERAISKKQSSVCRLLFVGKEWERKGGKLAFQTLLSLRKRGIDAELVIVGCVPPAEIKHEKLKVIPYLDKNVPQQRQQLDELFLNSNFFILPTRADCSPIVLCEANAFGLPVITTDVCGISSLITNGKNGYTLPLSASGDDYAQIIVENFSDPTRYEYLVRSSREKYDTQLNWDKWAEKLHHLFIEAIEQKNLPQQVTFLESAYKKADPKYVVSQ
jgi:glycosyltransferase involved in cell wall biosynthesis